MKLTQLESLRGAMALWVFVSHALPSAGIDRDSANLFYKLFLSGGLAVDVFIILSGFVITLTLNKQYLANTYTYIDYIKARFFRIFPILFVTTIFAALLINVSISALETLPWEIKQNFTRLEYLDASRSNIYTHIIAHMSMMHGVLDFILPYSSYSINGPAWSISLEWQFYLIAPFIIGVIFKNKISCKLTIFVVVAVFMTFIRYFYSYPSFLPNKIEFFIVGICSYLIYEKFKNTAIALHYFIIVISVVFLLTKSIPLFIWSFFLWLILDSSSTLSRRVSCLVNIHIFQSFGKMSYSFYLIHMPVIYLSMYGVNLYFTNLSQMDYLLCLLFLSFSITLLISYFLYEYVEKSFIKIGKIKFNRGSI